MKTAIQTGAAPAAIGPYTQAIQVSQGGVGGMLYTSGQIPLDPATMEMVAGGIAEQTEQVLRNLGAVLAAAGAGFADVVKTTVFLKDLGQFAGMNEVYGRYLAVEGMTAPARSTVEVARLPRGAMVEIELVAVVPV